MLRYRRVNQELAEIIMRFLNRSTSYKNLSWLIFRSIMIASILWWLYNIHR